MATDFVEWLKTELAQRHWTAADLRHSAQSRGYPINSPQLSRILSREQDAGVDYVIAIAHGLGVTRETAFRARGWLATAGNETMGTAGLSDEVISLAKDLDTLPIHLRGLALKATRALVDVFIRAVRE